MHFPFVKKAFPEKGEGFIFILSEFYYFFLRVAIPIKLLRANRSKPIPTGPVAGIAPAVLVATGVPVG